MKRTFKYAALSSVAMLAAAATGAQAADLGGNCCADLEERIAELEATTARKGNRKVSLTISGWVAEQVMYWDSGEESNIYVGAIGGSLASHVKFTGQAKIDADNSAGYVLHLRAQTVNSFSVNEDFDNGTADANSVQLYYSYWFIKNEKLGKLSIGQQSQASDNAAILPDGSGTLIAANWAIFDGGNFQLARNGVGLAAPGVTRAVWANLNYCGYSNIGNGGDCTALPTSSIRYDSPTFQGFSFSATWGEDDMWDVTGRYSGEVSGFKLAAAVSYAESTDETFTNPAANVAKRDSNYLQVGAYAQHLASGLFVYGAYGDEENNNVLLSGTNRAYNNDGQRYYVKAGLIHKWNALGNTIFWGEYGRSNDMIGTALFAEGVTGTQFDQWGLGVQQQIDAAAMSVWLKYRHYDGEITAAGRAAQLAGDVDSFDAVILGGLINF